METYVVINLPPNSEYTSKVDSKGGVNPRWNEAFGLLLPKTLLQRGYSRIKIEIYTLSTLGPKFVGDVSIPLSDISTSTHYKQTQYKRYPIKIATGYFHGELHISFNLGDKVVTKSNKAHNYPIMWAPISKPLNNQDHAKQQILEPYSQSNSRGHYSQRSIKYFSPYDEPSYPSKPTKLVSPHDESPYSPRSTKKFMYNNEPPYIPKQFKPLSPYEESCYSPKPTSSFSPPMLPQHVVTYPTTNQLNKVTPIASSSQPTSHTMMKPHQTYLGSTLPITTNKTYSPSNVVFTSPLGKVLLGGLGKSTT